MEDFTMKRVISLLLAFVMSVGMLVGCGGKDDFPEGEVQLKVGIPQSSTISNYDSNGVKELLEMIKQMAPDQYDETKKIFDTTNKYSGFFGSIRRMIKKSI